MRDVDAESVDVALLVDIMTMRRVEGHGAEEIGRGGDLATFAAQFSARLRNRKSTQWRQCLWHPEVDRQSTVTVLWRFL